MSQELEVEREGEMAHILGALNVVVIVDQLDGSLAAMRHRVLLVRFSMLVSDLTEDFLLVILFEGPPLWQERVVEDVCVLGLEPNSLNNFAEHCASKVTEV